MTDPSDPSPELPPTIEANSPVDTDEVVQILKEYLAALKAGKAPTRQELLARHPAIAPRIDIYLAGVDFIQNVEANPPALSGKPFQVELGNVRGPFQKECLLDLNFWLTDKGNGPADE